MKTAVKSDLAQLVPIAVVIAAGCEPCAEKMVTKALAEGAAADDVRRVLGIVKHLQGQECFTRAVGEEAVQRMDSPLARGQATLDGHTIVEAVKDRYGKIATGDSCGCGAGTSLASKLGYDDADADVTLGCGAPIERLELQPGETVLDLGSGAGLDARLAAAQVGPEGKVIGVDMTPEMIERAREDVRQRGLTNVEFLEGRLERLPVPDESVDAVTSNCVVNLVPDKRRVFDEIGRVLRPGGRLVISDIVLGGKLPEAVERSVMAWVGCVAGALPREEYFSIVNASGLDGVEILEEVDLSTMADGFLPEGTTIDELRGKVLSVTFRAVKA